ncbi:MAG: hypothetical protein ACTSQI_21725, partial [Candidatus Helarchaeota archaeon]
MQVIALVGLLAYFIPEPDYFSIQIIIGFDKLFSVSFLGYFTHRLGSLFSWSKFLFSVRTFKIALIGT